MKITDIKEKLYRLYLETSFILERDLKKLSNIDLNFLCYIELNN